MKVLVFDIDGVLCEVGSDYCNAQPFPHAIAEVNRCYELGHRIVLQTARGMKRFTGDVLACERHLAQVTKGWLEQHGVKYHELHFGKRSGDLYVDDKCVRVDSSRGAEDWEKNFRPRLEE